MFISIVLASAVSLFPAAQPIFPCVTGKTLTYRGQVRWTVENSNVVRSKPMTWQTRILSCKRKAHGFVWVIDGLPEDLVRYQPNRKPGRYLFTQNANGFSKQKLPTEEGQPVEEILHFPAKVGDCLREDETTGRNGAMYCWSIDSTRKTSQGQEWLLKYRSLPLHEAVTIIPEIGITSYEFEHHGTVASVKMRLVNQ
jgi:hypothetical protein